MQGNSREAWDGNPPLADAARQRLLAATARCIAREGMSATSVAAIAAEASVSRQTVYRYFAGRDEVVAGPILDAAEGLRRTIDPNNPALADPADMIVEALVLGLAEIRSEAVLRAIWDSSRLDGSIAMGFTEPVGIAWTRQTLALAVEAAGWNEAEADAGLELILRIFLSLVISPSPKRSTEEIRAFLYRHLIPGLDLAVSEEN